MRDLTNKADVEEILNGLRQVDLYVGIRLDNRITVRADAQEVTPQWSQQVWNHSPDGFNWGYGGSGPAQLALAILLYSGLPEEVAVALHQDFKWKFVANWADYLNWFLRGSDLRHWIEQQLWAEREKQLQAPGGPLDEP
jgi:hypothetical protein